MNIVVNTIDILWVEYYLSHTRVTFAWSHNAACSRLWRHYQNVNRASEERNWGVNPYPDGVAIECLWSVDGVYYFHRPECTLQCHSDLMEWYWSGIGVYFESGIGVVVAEWQWSVHFGVALECTLGVALECTLGVALECATGVALECVANMQINTAMPLQSGNGVVRMGWQWSVHFIATPANFWK